MSEISRVTRSKEEARATYDALSRWYDALAGGAEAGLRRLGLQILDVQPGEQVLEIGFGTGQGVLALAQSVGTHGKVYGIDISPAMLAVAMERIGQAGLSARVELRCGDAAALPFEAEAFDAVFMCFTLELFDTPEIPVVIAECHRVLRQKGRLCTVSMSTSERRSFSVSVYEWAHRAFPRFADCRPIPAQQFLEASKFAIRQKMMASMWGLPASIILSAKVE